jgi:hypothetical protein
VRGDQPGHLIGRSQVRIVEKSSQQVIPVRLRRYGVSAQGCAPSRSGTDRRP